MDARSTEFEQFNLFGVFSGAENDTQGRRLVFFALILIEPAQIQLHLPFVCRTKLIEFQFNRHQATQVAMKKEQVQIKIVFVND